ncbi:MAG: hypothetical protein EAZ19_01145 [Oscillatoriales cyanobacterium]|nr:MAG: hypothetical protein EAZ19_01145 [Oscillatoriales cyanobacterium]
MWKFSLNPHSYWIILFVEASYWLLVIGYWLLVIGYWLLVPMPCAGILPCAGLLPNALFAQCPVCPMPNAQFPIPNSQFPIPNSQFPIQILDAGAVEKFLNCFIF